MALAIKLNRTWLSESVVAPVAGESESVLGDDIAVILRGIVIVRRRGNSDKF